MDARKPHTMIYLFYLICSIVVGYNDNYTAVVRAIAWDKLEECDRL